MKKRVLSLLMTLALCFTMLPTAAVAEMVGANTAGAYAVGEDTGGQGKQDQQKQDEQKQDQQKQDEAVQAAQALIDALPEEVTADGAEELQAQLIAVDKALAELDDEQLAALDMARYEALCAAPTELTAEQAAHSSHPICGDTSCKEHGAALTDWKGVSSLDEITGAGHYYLTGPVTLTRA